MADGKAWWFVFTGDPALGIFPLVKGKAEQNSTCQCKCGICIYQDNLSLK